MATSSTTALWNGIPAGKIIVQIKSTLRSPNVFGVSACFVYTNGNIDTGSVDWGSFGRISSDTDYSGYTCEVYQNGQADYWWLRSPEVGHGKHACFVYLDGDVYDVGDVSLGSCGRSSPGIDYNTSAYVYNVYPGGDVDYDGNNVVWVSGG